MHINLYYCRKLKSPVGCNKVVCVQLCDVSKHPDLQAPCTQTSELGNCLMFSTKSVREHEAGHTENHAMDASLPPAPVTHMRSGRARRAPLARGLYYYCPVHNPTDARVPCRTHYLRLVSEIGESL